MSQSKAIRYIEDRTYDFFVSIKGTTTDVIIGTYNGNKYLKTIRMRRTKTICWSCRNARENKVDSIIIWWGSIPWGAASRLRQSCDGRSAPTPLLVGGTTRCKFHSPVGRTTSEGGEGEE